MSPLGPIFFIELFSTVYTSSALFDKDGFMGGNFVICSTSSGKMKQSHTIQAKMSSPFSARENQV